MARWVNTPYPGGVPLVHTSSMNAFCRMVVKRVVGLGLVATLLAMFSSGCQTAHGFGKDVEKVGEKIQDGTH